MAIQLEQRIDLQKITPTKWRLVGLVGQAIFYYAEVGTDKADFTANNELGEGDVGSWRAIDGRRRLVVGFGGKATAGPKTDGKPGEIQVQFEDMRLAL